MIYGKINYFTMHIHIASTGGRTENIQTGFNAVSSVDKLYLVYSNQRKHSAEDLQKNFTKIGVECIIKGVSGFDFQEIVDVIYEIYGENVNEKNLRYTINITGGTNLMAAAICSTAFFINAEIYYVMYDREKEKNGIPQDSVEERVKRIPVPKIPNVNGLRSATREILEYILDNDGPDLTSVKVADAFGYSRQALKHHTDILKKEGIIEIEKWTKNNRLSRISLTQEGRMVAGWIKNFNRTDKKLAEKRTVMNN